MHTYQTHDRRALLTVFVVVLAAATLGMIAAVSQRIDNADAEASQAIDAGQELDQKIGDLEQEMEQRIDDLESELEDLKEQPRRYR